LLSFFYSLINLNYEGAGVDTEFWGFSGNNPYDKQQEPFMKWLYLVGNTSDTVVPKLFSTSYGEDEQSIPLTWSVRTNTEFQKCGARGISLLFASGDSGASGDNGCGKDDHGNAIFVPQWPSGSPYVTAVGGAAGGSATTAETVAGLSSGGFSNRWKRPKWQQAATSNYLKNASGNLPSKIHFNSTGRGFPDIAAEAVDFVIVQFGLPLPGVSGKKKNRKIYLFCYNYSFSLARTFFLTLIISTPGTSCASPTAAGIFGLLNDLRASSNKTSLGFLNPFIYQHSNAFNDIVKGMLCLFLFLQHEYSSTRSYLSPSN
jgi:tripeptidyl-peptidase I